MNESISYDIVVIGAGIQGAGIAQAAAVSGYKTLVIEKFPEAGMGTSCKSSKLIHGGLRYLESGQFKLVRECLQERKRLLNNAPELVKLIPFYIPVYTHSKRPAWLVWLGLTIYSFFSFKAFSIVKKSKWHLLDGMELKNLQYVFKYYDAQTDDKELTQAVILSALQHGANIDYNAEFLQSNYADNLHTVTYKKDNEPHTIKCRCIINCSGPWIEPVQNKISPQLEIPHIDLVAGSHIVIDRPNTQGAYYIEAKDKRAIFILPWGKQQTLIGTTERVYADNPEHVSPREDEILYLLDTYNLYFMEKIGPGDIVNSYSGLRVLPSGGKSVFHKSRESLLIQHPDTPGLFAVVGGKLTSYRAIAEKTISLVQQTITLKNRQPPGITRKLKLKKV